LRHVAREMRGAVGLQRCHAEALLCELRSAVVLAGRERRVDPLERCQVISRYGIGVDMIDTDHGILVDHTHCFRKLLTDPSS